MTENLFYSRAKEFLLELGSAVPVKAVEWLAKTMEKAERWKMMEGLMGEFGTRVFVEAMRKTAEEVKKEKG